MHGPNYGPNCGPTASELRCRSPGALTGDPVLIGGTACYLPLSAAPSSSRHVW